MPYIVFIFIFKSRVAAFVVPFWPPFLLLFLFTSFRPPKGGRGCLMSPPCLESQGCHLISLCYLTLLPSPVTLSLALM